MCGCGPVTPRLSAAIDAATPAAGAGHSHAVAPFLARVHARM
jgi:hypothetical protein